MYRQVVEHVLESPKISSQVRNLHCTVELIPDVLVPEMVEQLVKLPKTVFVDRIQQRTVERIVDIPVPQDVKELVEVSRVSQDRIQQRFVEQTDATPDISFAEKIVEKPVTQTQGKTQQVVNTRVQHLVPLLQFTDKVVDIPVVAQRQICVNQKVQKTIEDLQLQYTEGGVNVPVVLVVLVPQVQVVAETAEIPQLHVVEEIGEILEWLNFVRGVVDSADFTVYIPRETLQQIKILRVVNKTLVKSRLQMLAEI